LLSCLNKSPEKREVDSAACVESPQVLPERTLQLFVKCRIYMSCDLVL